MDRVWHWKFALVLGLSGTLFGCKTPTASTGAMPSAAPQNPITKAWKSTTDSVAAAFTIKPKTIPADDPVSLDSKPAKISANTYIATGRLLESRQELAKAQAEYEKAIKAEPTNLTALVSLARIQDRQERPDLAIATYQKALKAHPQSALLYNDLGLCYARKRDLASAVAMLHKAVELEAGKPNYRNNLATVLVEAGRYDEALRQLQAVHSPAAAHYNLAFLLNHRGQADQARRHLQMALELDPALTPAQAMLAQISGGAGETQVNGFESPQIGVSQPLAAQPQADPAAGTVPQTGPYGPTIPSQSYPPAAEAPIQSAEPVFHINGEGVEASPADGPSVHQPTMHQYPSGASTGSKAQFHLDDAGEESQILVVTHLVYGKDRDPAPEPLGLVDDEPAQNSEAAESAEATGGEGPVQVKPVSVVPTLQPVAE